MRIVNELARRVHSNPVTGVLADPAFLVSWPDLYFDSNGDAAVTALDALRVINQIARGTRLSASPEGESFAQMIRSTLPYPPPLKATWPGPFRRRGHSIWNRRRSLPTTD